MSTIDPAIRNELAPTGRLRAAINYNNPLLARRDSASGILTGLAIDPRRANEIDFNWTPGPRRHAWCANSLKR